MFMEESIFGELCKEGTEDGFEEPSDGSEEGTSEVDVAMRFNGPL